MAYDLWSGADVVDEYSDGGISWDEASLGWEMPSFDYDYSSTSFDWDNFFSTEGIANMSTEAADAASGAWWSFDQSKISGSIQDVLNGVGSGLKASVQSAVSNAPKTAAGFFDTWIKKGTQSFLTTATGQQVEQAAIEQKVKDFATNPMTLLVIGGLFLFFMLAFFRRA